MGLLDKINSSSKQEEVEVFTAEEYSFILAKLRLATYTGNEFEQFYNIYVKLLKELQSKK